MTERNLVPSVAPLPSSLDDWKRVTKVRPTFNDLLEAQLRKVIEGDAKLLRLLSSVSNEDSIEGKLVYDKCVAAGIVRAYAEDNGFSAIAQASLNQIVRGNTVVLRRYGLSPKQRKPNGGEATRSEASVSSEGGEATAQPDAS